MDSFMKLGQQAFQAYEKSQSSENVNKTGGEQFNGPHSQQGGPSTPSIDTDEAVRTANNHSSGDSSALFSSAMSFIGQNKGEHHDPVNEEHVVDAHEQAYSQGNAGSLSASSMGAAAALHALKQFTSSNGGAAPSSGGGTQTKLISMAMAEATKLFDGAGGAASGNKQDAVNGAAMTVMKLLVQSKFSSAIGGSNSGGLGSLMSTAMKFAQ